jgi:hypothetical protein
MTPPETRYARSGDLRIAYQVAGTGPFDLVYAADIRYSGLIAILAGSPIAAMLD